MRITRLEIFGFKSFVDRFVLNFDSELLAVVGPNGCGKSNVVDSLRWVLGETHAKQLRGSVLEDLIFNGSDSRRPLGMAEVSITIRPEENWAGGEVQECEDEPTFFPGEDRLPGQGQEAGTAENSDESFSASEGLDSSEQQPDDPSSNPESKSLEAVGLRVLPGGKEISESGEPVPSKPDNILPDSVLSIPGLFSATEIQMTRRLYRSGESEYFINKVPCRLRDMIELYRVIGLGARGLSIVQQGQIGEIVRKKPLERRELLEEAAGIAGIRARLEAASRKLLKTSDNLARLKDIILEVEKQVRSLDRQAKRAKKRGILKQEIRELESKQFVAKTSQIILGKDKKLEEISALEEKIAERKSKISLAEADEEKIRSEVQQIEVQLVDKRRERDALLAELNQARRAESDIRVAVAKLEAELKTADNKIASAQEREQKFVAEIDSYADRLSAVDEKLKILAKQKEEVEQRSTPDLVPSSGTSADAGLATSIQTALASVENSKQDQKRINAEIESNRQKSSAVAEELSAFQAEKLSIEKHIASLSFLETEGAPKDSNSSSEEGTLAGRVLVDGIRVPEELETAVSAVLGKSATYRLVAEDLRSLVARVSKKSLAGGIFTEVCAIDIPPSNQAENRLIDHLKIDSDFNNVLESLIGHVLLADSVEDGVNKIQQTKNNSIAVTRDGITVTPWGIFETASEGQHVGMRRRADQLQDLIQEKSSSQSAYQQTLAGLKSDLETSFSALSLADTALSELYKKQNDLAFAAEQARDEAVAKERALQEEIKSIVAEESNLESERKFSSQRKDDIAREVQVLKAEVQHLVEEKSLTEEKKKSIGEQLSLKFDDPNSPVRRRAHELEDHLLEIDREIAQIEGCFDGKRRELVNSSEKYGENQNAFNSLNNKLSSYKLEVEKADLELGLLREDIGRLHQNEAEIPGEAAIAEIIAESEQNIPSYVVSLGETLRDLRTKLEREGEVDPEAVDRFQEETTRLEQLRVQYEDLDSARKTLVTTINQLREISGKRFLDAFEFVSKKFSELVPRLFGGGAGSLHLANPEDPLSSGVELTVRPPGKKLQSIELMSGGEKALAATAIIVAMFLYRPSPICVLDEVDAPLDDANLDRFLSLVKEISSSTQFLLITHNKQTMAVAGRLLGITMQEKGVSRALEVDLEEAEKVVVNG